MGYKIKERRVEIGITQEELAEKSGVSRTIICALESGKRCNTTAKTLLQIATALNCTVNDIFFADNA